jgi:mono/diheme cytochrome c family protein
MKNCRLQIARLKIVNALIVTCGMLFCMSAVYASQAKPAAKPAAAAAKAAAKASPESIANGETIYKRQCQMCHGPSGMGDGPAAKMLKGKLPNMSDKAVMGKIKDETEVGNMPAFKAKLKPEEIDDVINYVHTLAK